METKTDRFNVPHLAYYHRLVNSINEGLDQYNYRNDGVTEIWEADPGTIHIKWKQYVFVMDMLDGMYVGDDETLTDFMYYHHSEVLIPKKHDEDGEVEDPNGEEFERVAAPINADWYNIRVIDAILERAKAFAYIDLMMDYIEKTAQSFQLPNDRVRRFATGKCIHAVEKLFRNAFITTVGIDPEADKGKYTVKAYPCYMSDTDVLVHVRLDEFDDKGYVNKDNAEFFLTFDLLTNNVKITPDLPWVMPADFNAELYTVMPRNIDTDRVLLSAIRIAVDDMILRVHQQCKVEDLYAPFSDIKMTPDNGRVQAFMKTFESKLRDLAGKGNSKLTNLNHSVETLSNGITRIIIGRIIVDVAIDGLGLADAGTFRMFTQEDSWDDIIWNCNAKKDVPRKPRLSEIGDVYLISDIMHDNLYNGKRDIATETILTTICDVVNMTLDAVKGGMSSEQF